MCIGLTEAEIVLGAFRWRPDQVRGCLRIPIELAVVKAGRLRRRQRLRLVLRCTRPRCNIHYAKSQAIIIGSKGRIYEFGRSNSAQLYRRWVSEGILKDVGFVQWNLYCVDERDFFLSMLRGVWYF